MTLKTASLTILTPTSVCLEGDPWPMPPEYPDDAWRWYAGGEHREDLLEEIAFAATIEVLKAYDLIADAYGTSEAHDFVKAVMFKRAVAGEY